MPFKIAEICFKDAGVWDRQKTHVVVKMMFLFLERRELIISEDLPDGSEDMTVGENDDVVVFNDA